MFNARTQRRHASAVVFEAIEGRRFFSASIRLVPLLNPADPAGSTASTQAGTQTAFAGNSGVVVWEDDARTGGGILDIVGRRYDAGGKFIGNTFRISSSTGGDQAQADVAAFKDGAFVVVWTNHSASGSTIVGRRFNPNGNPNGSQFNISTVAQFASAPVIGTSGDGTFVVAWQETGADGSGLGIFARAFSSSGTPAEDEFQVNSTTLGDQENPAIAVDASGNFIVAYDTPNLDSSGFGVALRRYDSNSEAVSNETQVNTTQLGDQTEPSIAFGQSGQYIVAWQCEAQDGSGEGAYFQRFSSGQFGTSVIKEGSETRAAQTTAGDQSDASLATASNGDFVIGWIDGHSGNSLTIREFNSSGSAVTPETIVATNMLNGGFRTDVAYLGTGARIAAVGTQNSDDALFAVERGQLLVSGTGGNDSILLSHDLGDITVNVNNLSNDFFVNEFDSISVSAGAGNDTITMPANLPGNLPGLSIRQILIDGGTGNDVIHGTNLNDLIHGGDGNDSILAGAGDDVIYGDAGQDAIKGEDNNDLIFGSAGDDSLQGNAGRDILIGGDGLDRADGGSGADIVTGGSSIYDNNSTALMALAQEWNRTDIGYAARVDHITNGGGLNGSFRLNASTVSSSGAIADVLTGGADSDLFLAAGFGDKITDLDKVLNEKVITVHA